MIVGFCRLQAGMRRPVDVTDSPPARESARIHQGADDEAPGLINRYRTITGAMSPLGGTGSGSGPINPPDRMRLQASDADPAVSATVRAEPLKIREDRRVARVAERDLHPPAIGRVDHAVDQL